MNEQINKTRLSEGGTDFAKVDDPRIESPEIKVVYPSITHDLPRYEPLGINEPTEPTPTPDPPKEEEKHECKVNWQDAIKQNGIPFLLIALGILGLGILIGKKNVAH